MGILVVVLAVKPTGLFGKDAGYMGSLMAEQAPFLGSFEMLLNVMIGGVGAMAGPVIGRSTAGATRFSSWSRTPRSA